MGWAGGGRGVHTLSTRSREECGAGPDLPLQGCGMGPGAGEERGLCPPRHPLTLLCSAMLPGTKGEVWPQPAPRPPVPAVLAGAEWGGHWGGLSIAPSSPQRLRLRGPGPLDAGAEVPRVPLRGASQRHRRRAAPGLCTGETCRPPQDPLKLPLEPAPCLCPSETTPKPSREPLLWPALVLCPGKTLPALCWVSPQTATLT